jgi:hypothetical protein
MGEGFSTDFLPSGVSPRAITEVLDPDVPTTFFKMLSTDLSGPANTLWLTGNSGVSPGPIIEVLGPDILLWHDCFEHFCLGVGFVVS